MGAEREREIKFADLVFGGATGPKAAAACGYGGSSQALRNAASRLMKRAGVKKRLEELRAASAEKAHATLDEALTILTEQLRGDLGPYLKSVEEELIPGSGVKFQTWAIDIEKMKQDGKTHLLAGVEITDKGTIRVKTYDKQGAIDRLAKLFGWNKPEKVDHGGTIAVVQEMTQEELAKRAMELAKKATAKG